MSQFADQVLLQPTPDPREERLLEQLTPAAAEVIRKVIADSQPDGSWTWAARQAFPAAVAAVLYPAFNHYDARRRAFLAESLTPAQRALAEICAARPWLAMLTPWPRWSVRRWLGLDPPGALERVVTHDVEGKTETGPRWRAFDAVRGDLDATRRLLEALPMTERLEVYGELYAGAYDLGGFRVAEEHLPEFPGLEQLRDEGHEWAPAYADAWLARHKTDPTNQSNPIHYYKIRRPLFLSFVRARLRIERRWEVFLPAHEANLVPECLDALADDRRGPALGASLPYAWTLEDVVERILSLLDRYPVPGLIDVIFQRHRENYPSPKKVSKATLGKLEVHAMRSPLLAGAIAANLSHKPVKLKATPLRRPAEAALTPVQRQQVAEVERETFDLLDFLELSDGGGTTVYDAVIHAGCDGWIFRHGTADKVAMFAQHSADGDDAELCHALDKALTPALKKLGKKPKA